MTVVGAGFVAGPAIGGLLVDAFDWPYVFFINIPLGLLGISAVIAVIENRDSAQGPREQQSRFDWLGAVLSAGALVAPAHGYDQRPPVRLGVSSHPGCCAELCRSAQHLHLVGAADSQPHARLEALCPEILFLGGSRPRSSHSWVAPQCCS